MKQRGLAKPIMKEPSTTPPEAPKKKEELDFNPGYYVSNVSRQLIDGELEKGSIKHDDLTFILRTAKIVSQIFSMQQPTFYDIVVALQMKNPENIRAIAEGTVEMDVFRPEFGKKIKQPRPERVARWKNVATILLNNENLKK